MEEMTDAEQARVRLEVVQTGPKNVILDNSLTLAEEGIGFTMMDSLSYAKLSVETVGDVDGDGRADLLIRSNVFKAYLVWGDSRGECLADSNEAGRAVVQTMK